MLLQTILTLIIINVLRKELKKAGKLPLWKNFIIGNAVFTAILITVNFSLRKSQPVTVWFTYLQVALLYYTIYKIKDFSPVKPLLYAVLPLMALNLIEDLARVINRPFYQEWNDYLEIAELFALVFMITMLVINSRQKKALEKERLKNEEKQREFEITQKLKAELEVQVQERTAEITKQKEELEQTLDELRSTQAQLVQSEKMASLGELTAGIAHEIQNPLNFVNNFSEVSNELVEELKAERSKPENERDKNLEEEILKDIAQNLEKINHHGKRADAIVKGMLQHSRNSNGTKEPTDINALCDEYLRLAFHGFRAKDSSFNVDLQTSYDKSIGLVSIISQDIGRVVLNLITNAFHAINDRKHNGPLPYHPVLKISTFKRNGDVIIEVADNGNGIPDKILDKIFQPFFTTRPTGQGTGLGLSLSYDIVKAHGGMLKAETVLTKGATFIIELPA